MLLTSCPTPSHFSCQPEITSPRTVLRASSSRSMSETTPSPQAQPSEGETSERAVRGRQATACAACRLRKVKCNGQDPCAQCAHTGLACVYPPERETKPRARRGKLIMEYKRQTSTSSPYLPMLLPSAKESGRNLDKAFFRNLVSDYVTHAFPLHPIIPEHEVRRSIEEMDSSDEASSLVHALAAYTMTLAYADAKGAGDCSSTIDVLVNASVRARSLVVAGYTPSVRSCLTSFYLHCHFSSMRDAQASFFYLREAATLVQMLGVEDLTKMASLSVSNRAQYHRLHWLLYMNERTWAILDE